LGETLPGKLPEPISLGLAAAGGAASFSDNVTWGNSSEGALAQTPLPTCVLAASDFRQLAAAAAAGAQADLSGLQLLSPDAEQPLPQLSLATLQLSSGGYTHALPLAPAAFSPAAWPGAQGPPVGASLAPTCFAPPGDWAACAACFQLPPAQALQAAGGGALRDGLVALELDPPAGAPAGATPCLAFAHELARAAGAAGAAALLLPQAVIGGPPSPDAASLLPLPTPIPLAAFALAAADAALLAATAAAGGGWLTLPPLSNGEGSPYYHPNAGVLPEAELLLFAQPLAAPALRLPIGQSDFQPPQWDGLPPPSSVGAADAFVGVARLLRAAPPPACAARAQPAACAVCLAAAPAGLMAVDAGSALGSPSGPNGEPFILLAARADFACASSLATLADAAAALGARALLIQQPRTQTLHGLSDYNATIPTFSISDASAAEVLAAAAAAGGRLFAALPRLVGGVVPRGAMPFTLLLAQARGAKLCGEGRCNASQPDFNPLFAAALTAPLVSVAPSAPCRSADACAGCAPLKEALARFSVDAAEGVSPLGHAHDALLNGSVALLEEARLACVSLWEAVAELAALGAEAVLAAGAGEAPFVFAADLQRRRLHIPLWGVGRATGVTLAAAARRPDGRPLVALPPIVAGAAAVPVEWLDPAWAVHLAAPGTAPPEAVAATHTLHTRTLASALVFGLGLLTAAMYGARTVLLRRRLRAKAEEHGAGEEAGEEWGTPAPVGGQEARAPPLPAVLGLPVRAGAGAGLSRASGLAVHAAYR